MKIENPPKKLEERESVKRHQEPKTTILTSQQPLGKRASSIWVGIKAIVPIVQDAAFPKRHSKPPENEPNMHN